VRDAIFELLVAAPKTAKGFVLCTSDSYKLSFERTRPHVSVLPYVPSLNPYHLLPN